MSLTLIMPCAGKSTRFNSTKPKWMLTHPNGNLMLVEAINGLNLKNVTRLVITVVQEHINSSKIKLEKLKEVIFNLTSIEPEFLILSEFTSSQSETVYKTIKMCNVNESIFIKDCDNYFQHEINEGNYVNISLLKPSTNAVNKSYVSLDKFGNLAGIVEKKVIGDKFCVGGYSFKSAQEFIECFESIQHLKGINAGEIYISHIIQKMLIDEEKFKVEEVLSYHDWGTIEDWEEYTSKIKTFFVDIDGVLAKNSSQYFEPEWGTTEGLVENIKTVNSLYDSGSYIVLTTARKEEYRAATLNQLSLLNIKYHQIVFNLPHTQRVLINDYANTNPFPSAVSINLERDRDNLKIFL